MEMRGEINFNRHFYRDAPRRPLEESEADIRAVEQDVVRMLAEVTGTGLNSKPQGTPSEEPSK